MAAPAPARIPRRFAVGSDTRHATAEAVAAHLRALGLEVIGMGAVGGPEMPWPVVAEQVAREVARGTVDHGVVCCWTGTGVSIAANKVAGVRAALCRDPETAVGARRWNDANVLALSLAGTDPASARAIVDAWLATDGIDPDESENIARLDALEIRDGEEARRVDRQSRR